MTDRNLRSLPPLVDGIVYGHLVVKIDEILWCKKYSGDVIVLLQWWGETDSVTFRPADVSKYPESARSDNSIKYNIQTNFSLFETYLKQCNKLKLLVVNDVNKEIIGHVEINNLQEHITNIQLQKYFSVVTSSGSRIGDLRVDFDLSMNTLPEEPTKKTRKRSRRKTKLTNNSFRSTTEEEKSKQFKKGCKTGPNHITNSKKSLSDNLLDFEMPESPKTNQVPPNTGRSDTSDYVLLDVLEKGKKLRDAMVMSVLDDSDVPSDLNEGLLLKLDHGPDNDNKLTYKSSTTTINGEMVTPHEEKLISNYLKGKAMKEEEEKLVLTALHPENPNETTCLKDDIQKQGSCCHISKNSDVRPTQAAGTSDYQGTNTASLNSNFGSLMRKINCFRLTVDNLTLTPAGRRKINQATDSKKNGDTVGPPPPGATYFVECHFVEETPRSQAQLWRASPLRFCSRRQIEDVVYFGQSSAHSLKAPYSVSELEAVNCLVCWRHLHQRVPALLGSFSLAPLLRGGLEMQDTLPVVWDNVTVVGHIKVKLQLGKDKLYFGNELLEEAPRDFKFEKKTFIDNETDRTARPKETPRLNVKDLEINSEPKVGKNKEHCDNSAVRNQKEGSTVVPLANYMDIPLCTNCGQNMMLMSASTATGASLCVSCSSLLGRHPSVLEPNYQISIPTNFTSKERRHHEFLLGIDTVKGFPLFANTREEVSCYVDYKFPQITSGLKAEMCSAETTSRVVDVETQLCLASVHRHSLTLPVVLPLSPLLAACSSGVTLRLWLRYYKPTPRDHMVAMALLPMDELCLMELEFDERHQEIAITKVLELPLALVPSSVTAPYQKCPAGTLRVTVTYSNFITPPPKLTEEMIGDNKEENSDVPTDDDRQDTQRNLYTQHDLKPISALLDRLSGDKTSIIKGEEKLKEEKNRFWTGPFGKENVAKSNATAGQDPSNLGESAFKTHQSPNNVTTEVKKIDSAREMGSSHPVMKEDLDILAESIEHRFNRLQSELLKEKQRGLAEVNSIVTDTKKMKSSLNVELEDDYLSFHSLMSSNSSMESLPFILGPPADFKDIQNTVACSESKAFSESSSNKSVSDTIVGFFKEEKDTNNFSLNDTIEQKYRKPENTKPKTFKAMIKIDRAVNLKAVKAPSNGKKGKVPPSSWVSFGINDCCELHCGSGGSVCAGPTFTTPVIRRNHNPIWNMSWDVDLPVEYLQQEEKRLVFGVFEEQLSACVGRASASVAILRSGLPCLSTWLSIDDPQGACRGQLKVVVTPLEDLRQYQNCSVFEMEEDDFEELKDKGSEIEISESNNQEAPVFIASQTEVFLNENKQASSKPEGIENANNQTENAEAIDEEDPFSADDIISDYKNTLENNFRNEMAGLENLIMFLRVGSMSSELSFFRSTENKENLSSNPSPQYFGGETRTAGTLESYSNVSHVKSASMNHQPLNHNSHKDRCLIDATTETVDKGGFYPAPTQQSSEDILTKLLHQISSFQPPVIKIADNTSQTLIPETKESSTETCDYDSQMKPETNSSVCLKDASTETEDIIDKRSPRAESDNVASRHVCEELGNVLLKHFLTCKPPAVKVSDSTTQTDNHDGPSTVNSSGVFMSGISVDSNRDSYCRNQRQEDIKLDWSHSEAQTSSDRLTVIDNNIRDLEQFFIQNITTGRQQISPSHSKGSSEASMIEFSRNENSRSSSDVESLESYSQVLAFPRETPDGGDPTSNSDKTEAYLRRRGTFVIEKPNHNQDSKEKPSEDTV